MIDAAFRDAHRISPSQIETARLCLRKWGLEKLDKLPKKPNKYADRGTEAHSVLELWQRENKPVDLTTNIGKIVQPGLKFLPQPGTHAVEHNFVFDSGVAVYHGKMDLRGPVSFPIQSIWDHKTTRDFHWLKPPEVLRRDPQANIYAKATIEECKRAGYVFGQHIKRVEQNWVYYLADPDKPRSRKVQLHVLPDGCERPPERADEVRKEHFGYMYLSELEERFSEIEETAKQLLQLYHDHPKGLELPYDARACGAFGGCPYKDNPCKLTLGERITSMEEHASAAKTSMADKMRQRMGEKGAGQPSTTPEQAKAPAAQPTQQQAATTQANEQQQGANTQPTDGAAATPKSGSMAEKMRQRMGGEQMQPVGQGDGAQQDLPKVNPPEQKYGVDPDAPASARATPGGVAVASFGRLEIATFMAMGLVAGRVYNDRGNRFPVEVAKEAMQLADALMAANAESK